MAFGIGYFWYVMAAVGVVFLGKPFITFLCIFALILCLLHATGVARWLDERIGNLWRSE